MKDPSCKCASCQPYSKVVLIRTTQQQFNDLTILAGISGVSKSEYLRSLLKAEIRKLPNREEYTTLEVKGEQEHD